MSALPSFVDLVSSLGLEQEPHPPLSPPNSPPSPLTTPPESPTRYASTRRDATQCKQNSRRFLPYLRRGNSSKSTPEPEQRDQKHRRQLDLDHSDEVPSDSSDTSSDLNVDAPISIYVRKRRSGGSLTPLTYPREWNCDTSILLPCIPAMPPLLLDDLYTALNGEPTSAGRPRQRTGIRLSMPC